MTNKIATIIVNDRFLMNIEWLVDESKIGTNFMFDGISLL